MWEQCLEIARVNRRHNLLPHIAAAVVLCLMAPLLMGVKNLTEPQVAKIAEFYLSFLGVSLFVPLFLPDSADPAFTGGVVFAGDTGCIFYPAEIWRK